MNKINRSGRAGWLLASALLGALTGCTTYVVETPPSQPVPVPPPVVVQAPVVVAPVAVAAPPVEVIVVQTENDFDEPLRPYGRWVDVSPYGRCWVPGGVGADWRPYCNGHWERTDAGWYWASDEPWGWATYHYGRWDWNAEFGWIWVPQTQWAPAWVSFHEGGGYVGWAPLHPSARIEGGGFANVNNAAPAPREVVFVEERKFLEPVRPTTVIINNTTIVNKTVNITNIKIVNNTVINEGPRTAVIEQASGRKVQAVPARELRVKQEAHVAALQRPARSENEKKVPAVNSAVAAARETRTQQESARPANESRTNEAAQKNAAQAEAERRDNEMKANAEAAQARAEAEKKAAQAEAARTANEMKAQAQGEALKNAQEQQRKAALAEAERRNTEIKEKAQADAQTKAEAEKKAAQAEATRVANNSRANAREEMQKPGAPRAETTSVLAHVQSALAAAPEHKGVKAAMANGAVRLTGFVSTAEEKTRAGEAARKVEGVREVQNEIVVKP